MKVINPIFKTIKVKQYIADLIVDYGYESIDDLSHADKCEFASLLIEAAGRNSEHECIIESNHLDQTMGAIKKALAGTYQDDENLLYTLKENIVDYYHAVMEALFEEGFEYYQVEKREWIAQVRQYGEPDMAAYREGL
jgi:hypothetical protein